VELSGRSHAQHEQGSGFNPQAQGKKVKELLSYSHFHSQPQPLILLISCEE
jgi:hypothetical protein